MSLVAKISKKVVKTRREIHRALRRGLRPVPHPRPVFVVGCQRSGTSVTLRIFDQSLDATVFWPHDSKAYSHQLLRKPERIKELISQSRTTVAVFKPMNQIQLIPEYLAEYPGLKIVWLLRRYQDVVNSSARKWKSMPETLRQIVIDPQRAGWHGENLSQKTLEIVRTHYHDNISLESAYALFWYMRNIFYFEYGLDHNPNVKIFRYEQLVQQPEKYFAEMFKFCNVSFDPKFTRQIYSSSVGKNPPPSIDEGIKKLCEELTEAFQQHLSARYAPADTNI